MPFRESIEVHVNLCKTHTSFEKSYAFVKHVCAESYAKEKQFDDDRDKLEEDSPDYEGDNT